MEKKFGALLLFIIALSILARIFLFLSPTYYAEENIGIASAGAMRAEGLRPYADFVNSHPPLHIYLLAIFSEILGTDPLLSAKLLSLLLSIGIIILIYLAEGPVPATIFSASMPFFYWYSLSLPLLPMTIFLVAFHLLQKKGGGKGELNSLKVILALGAIFSELSAIPAIVLLAVLFGKPSAEGKTKFASDALLAIVYFSFVLAVFAGKPFFQQVVFDQFSGRAPSILSGFAGSVARNAKEILFSVFSASFPLIALSAFSRDKRGLIFSALSLALFAIFLPNLSNNTLQFIVPFLAISAGKAIEARPKMLSIIPAILAFSAILVFSGEGRIEQTPGIERMSDLLLNEKTGISDPTIWGSPEASLLSVKTGIPVAGNFFESTPTMLGILASRNSTALPRPTFLVVSEYYGAIDFYGEKLEYEEIGSYSEPVVGKIKIYKRKA